MSNKEAFVSEIQNAVDLGQLEFSPEAAQYFSGLTEENRKGPLTDKGIKILTFMQENQDKFNSTFKSKDIADSVDLTARQVSGSMQKLIKEGFCEKLGGNPVCYKLTEVGIAQSTEILDFS